MRQSDQRKPTTPVILAVTTVFQQWIQVTYDQIGDLNFKYPQMLDFGVLIFLLFYSFGILKILSIVSVEKSQPSHWGTDLSVWEQSPDPGSHTACVYHVWQITSCFYLGLLWCGKLIGRRNWKLSGWRLFRCYGKEQPHKGPLRISVTSLYK